MDEFGRLGIFTIQIMAQPSTLPIYHLVYLSNEIQSVSASVLGMEGALTCYKEGSICSGCTLFRLCFLKRLDLSNNNDFLPDSCIVHTFNLPPFFIYIIYIYIKYIYFLYLYIYFWGVRVLYQRPGSLPGFGYSTQCSGTTVFFTFLSLLF